MSYLKKLEPHKIKDFLEHRTTIRPYYQDLPLVEKVYIYEGNITPTRLVEDKNVYEITYIDPLFMLNGFQVVVEDEMVKNIIVFGHHPNRDPDTYLYCLPDLKKNVKYDTHYYDMLLTNLKTYYYDNCYFKLKKTQIKLNKMKSMFVQLNEGEYKL